MFQCIITRFKVKAVVPRWRFLDLLKVVDLCSGELSSYVEYGAAEDREDKVILIEEHTPVVGAFPSVVKREDAWGLGEESWEVGDIC